jgi:hypothetical protein
LCGKFASAILEMSREIWRGASVTAKQAYDHVAQRARLLLRLHDGLVNTRQRRIRGDWKSSFCHFMHWPQGAAIERVDSKDAVLVLRHGAALTGSDFSTSALDDLLRSSLTFGASALDRYMHERIVKRVITSFRSANLLAAQEKLTIPAILALRMTEALRKALKGGNQVRPANQLRIALQDSLHRRTFQNWREIEGAFELIGVGGLTAKLEKAYGTKNIAPIKVQLNTIVQRRNFIVHEGDLVRHQRGGQTRVHPLARKYVAESLDFLDTLVGHLEAVK